MTADFFPVTCSICNNRFWVKARVPRDHYTCEKCKSKPGRLNTIDPLRERMQSAKVMIVHDPAKEYSTGSMFYADEIRYAIIMHKKDGVERFTDKTIFRYADDVKRHAIGVLDYKRYSTMLVQDILDSPLKNILGRA